MFGLFLDGEATALLVEFGHAVALRVVHPVTEHGGVACRLCLMHSLAEQSGEPGAMENVVAQHEAHRIVTYELLADDESLRKAVGAGLLGI